jgi:hypothetical protein
MAAGSGSNRFSRVSPMFDFSLILILMVFGTAGLGILTNQKPRPVEYKVTGDTSNRELEQQVRYVSEAVERDKERIEQWKREAAELEKALANNGATTAEQRRAAEAAMAELKRKAAQAAEAVALREAELAQLEQNKRELEARQKAARQARDEHGERSRELDQIEADNSRIKGEIDRLSSTPAPSANAKLEVPRTPLMATTTTRKPVYVALIKGAVYPVREPFYTMTRKTVDRGGGRFESVIEVTKSGTGESVEQALGDGSQFRKLTGGVEGEGKYVALLVDAQSFGAFRRIRAHLRQRGVPFGWEPCTSASHMSLSASGQMIGEDQG